MAAHAVRTTARPRSRTARRRPKRAAWLPRAATRRRIERWLRELPFEVHAVVAAALAVTIWFTVNAIVQVVRKPTELFFPVAGVLSKTPAETWNRYAPLFRAHSTAVMTPPLLAALAQTEGAGNPVARTYWRWRATAAPFEVYRPASSAGGMYQITDGTFEQAKQLCIHDHRVVEDGPWHDFDSCWFNALYFRVVPSHAVEMTAALLDRAVAETLARHRIVNATLAQKQDLAALIHLCGAGAGDSYARRGLRLVEGQRCGDHDVAAYLAKVNAMKRVFARLAADD
ncbi:MAG TPA: hypothetical protein VNK91_03775 [Burkholderiaceae bacterium]|jgi:hypothetical protein|nr:hypothetical protein [Burkholderiaceae bacterium]